MKKLSFLLLSFLLLTALFSCKKETLKEPEMDSVPSCDAAEVERIEDATKNSDIATAEALEPFFEDEEYIYSFPSIKSQHITVYYTDGTSENVKDALENGKITPADLDKFHIHYYKEEKPPHTESFVATVTSENPEYMIVRPAEFEKEYSLSESIKVIFKDVHYDYLYGIGRRVVIYYEGTPLSEPEYTVFEKEISTDGFLDFSLSAQLSKGNEKVKILSADEINSFSEFPTEERSNLYYYGLDEVTIFIDEKQMLLEEALKSGRITLWGIVKKCNADVASGALEEIIYKDGGNMLYKYPDFNIIRYHTLDGNNDIYIGHCEMGIDVKDK